MSCCSAPEAPRSRFRSVFSEMMATCPETTTISSRHHRPRGIVSSIVANGIARLVINEERQIFAASLVAANDENFAINGVIRHTEEPSTSVADISVTEGDTGYLYRILDVPIEFFTFTNPITKISYHHLRLNHHAIKFETKELLIGDRAEIEIQQQLGAQIVKKLNLTIPVVHVGQMSLKIVTSQKIEPGYRRESICESCTHPIVEQSEDFLV
uniref:Uncharacterized protein n=1 Tax=Panagrolaimus sp. JU765 TaxID=591449 RepID=A0AC34PU76_9BILA